MVHVINNNKKSCTDGGNPTKKFVSDFKLLFVSGLNFFKNCKKE